MVIVVEKDAVEQVPLAGIVLVTVYVPGVLFCGTIRPAFISAKTRPPGEAVKFPALAPAGNWGDTEFALWQIGPGYENCALTVAVITIVAMVVAGQGPLPAKDTV
jgi:hypothetical protein